jgi:Na+/proline symporter
MGIRFVYLFIYLTLIGYITWQSSRSESASEYMNRTKSLSAWETTWTTFASLLTGYNFVLGVSFAYLYGFWYLTSFIGAAASFVVLYFFFKKRLTEIKSEHDLFSIGDYFGVRYGVSAKVIVNVILCAALFLFLTLQIFINTQLFSILLGVKKLTALLLTTGIVSAYLWIGGFKTSIKTDIFQGFLMLPITFIVFLFPFHFTWEKIPTAFDSNQLGFAMGLALLQFLSLLAQAESFQRVFASQDALSLKKGLTFSFALLLLVAGAMAYLGINFKFSGITLDPENLFIDGVLKTLPQWLGSFIVVSLIAAFMGTIDSSAFAFGVLLTRNRHTPSHSTVKQTRCFTLAALVASAFASFYLISFLSSVFALISLISIIGAALLLVLMYHLDVIELNTFLISSTMSYLCGLALKIVTDNPLTSLIPTAAGIIALLILKIYKRVTSHSFVRII